MSEKDTFEFTYSAKEQSEIKKIRNKYMAPKEPDDKMEQLKRLDEGVTKKPTIAALVIGIIGTLLLGFGMSLVMTDLALNFGGVIKAYSMFIGIFCGVVGIVLAGLAHPLYNRILKKEREKIAPEIIRLTDELMK